MPLYSMRDTTTGVVQELWLSMAEREQYLVDNPHVEQLVSAPPIGDSIRLGRKRPDGWFTDKMKEIKRNHRHSTVNTW